jgi:Hyaluronan / mRNA binding family
MFTTCCRHEGSKRAGAGSHNWGVEGEEVAAEVVPADAEEVPEVEEAGNGAEPEFTANDFRADQQAAEKEAEPEVRSLSALLLRVQMLLREPPWLVPRCGIAA